MFCEEDDLAHVMIEVADDLVDGDEDGGVAPGAAGGVDSVGTDEQPATRRAATTRKLAT